MKIAVSYLSSKKSKKETIQLIEDTTADYIHVDLMDGGFVSKKNFTTKEVEELLENHTKPLDIHLMVFDPIIYVSSLAKLNPEFITFHLEATKDIVKTIEAIKMQGIKAGITIRPDTDLYELMPYLSLVDLVLIMSVNPGEGGQEFMMSAVDRLQALMEIRKNNGLSFLIEIDGGINKDTIKFVKDVDIVVSGSFICNSSNYQERIAELLK